MQIFKVQVYIYNVLNDLILHDFVSFWFTLCHCFKFVKIELSGLHNLKNIWIGASGCKIENNLDVQSSTQHEGVSILVSKAI